MLTPKPLQLVPSLASVPALDASLHAHESNPFADTGIVWLLCHGAVEHLQLHAIGQMLCEGLFMQYTGHNSQMLTVMLDENFSSDRHITTFSYATQAPVTGHVAFLSES